METGHPASQGIAKKNQLHAANSPERAPAETSVHESLKWRDGCFDQIDETLAIEEPLEIRLAGRRFTLTMRTPGNDEELAAGFLLAEGFIAAASEIDEIRRLRDARGQADPNS